MYRALAILCLKNDKEAFDNTGFLFFILFFFNCLVYEFMAALALIL